jgi:SAM-dependent methyltransferase
VDMALRGKSLGADDLEHLDGPAAAYNYVRIADLVASRVQLKPIAPPVLDWGCGYGQVTWLLRRRGVHTVCCEVEERPARTSIPQLSTLNIDHAVDSVQLPYEPEAFGAVLSVGVLEHVPDLAGSLREVNRVLKRDGPFLIFMFPNRFSWAEYLAELRGISVHPNRYTFRQTRRILQDHGFTVEEKWRRNFLPRNLTGLSQSIKELYGRYYRQIESLDGLLANLPPTSLLSGVLELIARKD